MTLIKVVQVRIAARAVVSNVYLHGVATRSESSTKGNYERRIGGYELPSKDIATEESVLLGDVG